MKKKILFGFFVVALISVNVTLSFQDKQEGFHLGQFLKLSSANAEGGTNNYTVIPGGDIGSQVTTTFNCYNCGRNTWELVVQPISFSCQEGGNEYCPAAMGIQISAKCWYCHAT